MKKAMCIVLVVIVAFLLSLSLVSARKGVGLVWSTQTEVVEEGSVHCIEYGVYNPWDEDVNAMLTASEDFSEIITDEESDTKAIVAKTYHDSAIPVELCFRVPEVYAEDCLVGGLFCEQKCEELEKNYRGEIVVSESKEDTSLGGGAAGSSTALGVSAPLSLKVRCIAHSRDWTLLYASLLIIALAILGVALYRKYRVPPLLREQQKLEKLKAKISKMKKK